MGTLLVLFLGLPWRYGLVFCVDMFVVVCCCCVRVDLFVSFSFLTIFSIFFKGESLLEEQIAI